MSSIARTCLCCVVALSLSAAAPAQEQESKSAALAKQLASALDAAKLDSIAAQAPQTPDVFVAGLYFAGSEFLVVSAQYSAPAHMNDEIAKKDYRDAYLDLSSASVPATKVFIEDLGANGLVAKPGENQPFDTYEVNGKRTMFDGDWKKQQMSEDEYMKAFAAADVAYSKMLSALLDQIKKP
jgi:type II secretory pathway pseudopilin PulG